MAPNRWTGNRVKGSLFKISGRDSSGSYRRIQIRADDLGDLCQNVDAALFPDNGKEDPRRLPLGDVFGLWFSTLQVRDHTKREYSLAVLRFLRWTDSRGIRTLGELNRHHVQAYLAGLQGLAHATRIAYLKPVKSLGIWSSLNWEIRDFTKGIRIRNTDPIWDDKKQALSFEQVSGLLLWLRSHPDGASVLPGVALSGLCGLRLTEVFRLTWDSINLDRGTVTVCGMIKNRESLRTIPIPGLVLDILQDTPRGPRLIDGLETWKHYGKALGALLKDWGVVQIEPKGLRRTIETEAVRRGWQGYCLNRYLGRSPQSIQERHYIAMADDLQRVLREQVTSRIDQIVEPFRSEWNRGNPKVISLAR
ncbi:MAG: site-specific integrase [Candidatus Omnitrophica bacterium]|nr:site-specific integrase [Candidatus Omnitrophota bacterium]